MNIYPDDMVRKWDELEMPPPCAFVGDPAENVAGKIFRVNHENEETRRMCPVAESVFAEVFARTGMDEQAFLIDQAKRCVAYSASMITRTQQAAVAFMVEDMGLDASDPSVAIEATDFAVFLSNLVHEHLAETEGTPPVFGLAYLDALLADVLTDPDPAQREAVSAALERVAERVMNSPGQVAFSGPDADLVAAVLACKDGHDLAAVFDAVDRRVPTSMELIGVQPGVGVRFLEIGSIEGAGNSVVRRKGRLGAALAVRHGPPAPTSTSTPPKGVIDRANEAVQALATHRFAMALAVGFNLGSKLPFEAMEIRLLIALVVAVVLEFGEGVASGVADTGVALLSQFVPQVGPLRRVEPALRAVVHAIGYGWTATRRNSSFCLLFSRCATILNLLKTGILIAGVCAALGDPTGWFASIAAATVSVIETASAFAALGSAAPDLRVNRANTLLQNSAAPPLFKTTAVMLANKRGATVGTALFNPASWEAGSATHVAFLETRLLTDVIQSCYTIFTFFRPGMDGLTLDERLVAASRADERLHVWSAAVSCIGDLFLPYLIQQLQARVVDGTPGAEADLLVKIGMAAVLLNGMVLVGATERSRRAVLRSLIGTARRVAYVPLAASWVVQGVVRVLAVTQKALNWAVTKGMPESDLPAAVCFAHKKTQEPIKNEKLALRVYRSTEVPLSVPAAAMELRLRDSAPLFLNLQPLGSAVRFEPLLPQHLPGLRPPPTGPGGTAPTQAELCAWIAHASNYVMANIAKAARVSTTATETNAVREWRKRRNTDTAKPSKRRQS